MGPSAHSEASVLQELLWSPEGLLEEFGDLTVILGDVGRFLFGLSTSVSLWKVVPGTNKQSA